MNQAGLVLALALVAGSAGGQDGAAGGYRAEIETWRAQRETGLKADGGWLTVVGLHWLKEGTARFGSDPSNEIVLPPGSGPARAGVLEHREGKTSVRIERGVAATIGGKPAREGQLRPDTSGSPDVLVVGRLSLQVIERGGRFGIRLKDNESPARRAFKGLDWFPVQEPYRVKARFEPSPAGKVIPIPNVLGQVQDLPSPGRAVFQLGGREVSLEPVLEEPDAKELFFIFRDGTSGKETYGAGRFLYSEMPKDGTVVLDFNKAYSPPCAFTAFATCPLPPKQNWLGIRIEAGERASH